MINIELRRLILKMHQRPIGVIFRPRSKDYNLVKLVHLLQKLTGKWTDQDCIFLLIVVNERLVKVQHESVLFFTTHGWQKWNLDLLVHRMAACSFVSAQILNSTSKEDVRQVERKRVAMSLTFTASSPQTDSLESSSENSLTRLRPIRVEASLKETSSSCIATKISYTV